MSDIPREKVEKAIEEINNIDTEGSLQSSDGINIYGIKPKTVNLFKSECVKILNKLLEDE